MLTYQRLTPAIIETLQQILGSDQLIADPEKMIPYSHDEDTDARYHHLPEVVVFPQTALQVSQIVQLANRERIPITPRGAGTGLACGAVPLSGGMILSLERMNRLIELNADSMYMVVEPGMRTDEVQKAAKAAGLLYAGDPCSGDSCFIGGNAATNAGGNRAVKYGTTRDQIYALEVVTPTGEIVQLGGRLEKVSTGYSLEHLIIGSEGTLGIITQLTLRLIPLPQHTVDLLAVFPAAETAIAAVGKILHAGITPACMEFMDNISIQSVERFLNEKLPHSDQGHYLIIQLEGQNEDDLDDQSVRIDELCSNQGALTVLVADSQKIWRARKSFAEATRHESLLISKEDIVVPVDQIAEMMLDIARLSQEYGLTARTASHAGDGNIHLNLLRGTMEEEIWDRTLTAFQHTLYTIVYQRGGKLSGEHGIGYKRKQLMREFTPPAELAMMQAIKKALDPNLILNPGKIFDIS